MKETPIGARVFAPPDDDKQQPLLDFRPVIVEVITLDACFEDDCLVLESIINTIEGEHEG